MDAPDDVPSLQMTLLQGASQVWAHALSNLLTSPFPDLADYINQTMQSSSLQYQAAEMTSSHTLA